MFSQRLQFCRRHSNGYRPMTCTCDTHGFCPKRNTYVSRSLFKFCQAGKEAFVDQALADLALSRQTRQVAKPLKAKPMPKEKTCIHRSDKPIAALTCGCHNRNIYHCKHFNSLCMEEYPNKVSPQYKMHGSETLHNWIISKHPYCCSCKERQV